MGTRDVFVEHRGDGGDGRDRSEGISSSNNVGWVSRGVFLL